MVHLRRLYSSNQPIHTLGLGVFDGLHLGHRSIAQKCDALVTFYPHPDLILNKHHSLKRLTTLRELQILYRQLWVIRFNRKLSQVPYQAFLESLVDQIKPKKIVVGYDFKFGYQRLGTPETLLKWGQQNGIDVEILPPTLHEGVPIKSSTIRQHFEKGHFAEALQVLGHPYLMCGKVVHGENRGAALGFPTANVAVTSAKLLPCKGVYYGFVKYQGKTLKAILYIGSKPTFHSNQEVGLEVHIPHFNESLYGQRLEVYIEGFVRPEQHFSSKETLIAQIKQDILVLHERSRAVSH